MAEKNKSKESGKSKFNLQNQKHRSYLYTGLFFAAVLFFFIVNNTNGESEEGPYPPNYEIAGTTEMLNLADYKGKVVLLDFWATWCPPCRKGVPDLIELKNEFKSSEFEVIGISLDGVTRGGASKGDVVPFIKDYGINYPIVLGDNNISQQYGGVQSIPTSFVVDKDGYLISHHTGLVSKEQYIKEIKTALAADYVSDKKYIAPDFSLPEVK